MKELEVKSKKCLKSKWRLQLLYPHSLSLTAELLPTLECHSRADNHGTAATSELTDLLCLCWFFLALWCSFVCSLLISYMTVFECFSLRENRRCLCHSPQFTPFWQVPQGCSHTNGAVYRQQLLSPGHTQVCVCSSRGISMAGSNPISLPELSAAGEDSKSSLSPDSSCCCLVLEHKWLIANLAPRQEQSAKLLFIEVFLCAPSLSFLPSVRGGR